MLWGRPQGVWPHRTSFEYARRAALGLQQTLSVVRILNACIPPILKRCNKLKDVVQKFAYCAFQSVARDVAGEDE